MYRGIIRSRPICLPQNDCQIHLNYSPTTHCSVRNARICTEIGANDDKNNIVKNKDDDVAKRAPLLFCFQKEGVLKLSRASPS